MTDTPKTLDLAYEAGSILLENGAEISRVEETMRRIAGHYGVEDESFFVLSNGIMATGKDYARSKFIPIKGASLDKVVAVNQLSREVEQGRYTLEQLDQQLKAIRAMKAKPAWEQILASAVGSAAFCIIFGGGFMDCVASFIAGLVLWVFMLFVGSRRLSRIVGNATGGLLATLLCIGMYRLGLGDHLSNMIIGAIIPLIPGVPFTNGIRDMANEDYIAGVTRLLDALLTLCSTAMCSGRCPYWEDSPPIRRRQASPSSSWLLSWAPCRLLPSLVCRAGIISMQVSVARWDGSFISC